MMQDQPWQDLGEGMPYARIQLQNLMLQAAHGVANSEAAKKCVKLQEVVTTDVATKRRSGKGQRPKWKMTVKVSIQYERG